MGYGDCLKVKGLNLFFVLGNDLVVVIVFVFCGCYMVFFIIGCGILFGMFVFIMKIFINFILVKNKLGWIDFNVGVIVENELMEKICECFIDYIICVVSGELVNNEKKNYCEIVIFKIGVIL